MNQNDLSNKMKKRKSRKKTILISILSMLVIMIATALWWYNSIRSKVYVEYKPNRNETKDVSYNEVEGITNVLLLGTDGRTLDEPARTDSIIIATLDNNNKKVKLTTIMRDTVVNIPGYGESKINAAFALGSLEEDKEGKAKGSEGGVALLMETIEDSFKIKLDKYAMVNFWGLEAIIDEIGGIEVDIKDYEIDEVNKFIGEVTGLNSPPITKTGLQKVNGQQALSYARIRYVGNGDFERGERQSKVLYEVANKLKSVNPLKYVSIANTLAQYVKTNIDIPEALNLAYTIYKLPNLNFERLQIPQTELIARDYYYKDLGWCLLIDLNQNSKILHDFIFNNKSPNPEEFDLLSVENVAAAYNSEESVYNSIHNIRPEDYDDRDIDGVNRDVYNKYQDGSGANDTQGDTGRGQGGTGGTHEGAGGSSENGDGKPGSNEENQDGSDGSPGNGDGKPGSNEENQDGSPGNNGEDQGNTGGTQGGTNGGTGNTTNPPSQEPEKPTNETKPNQ